MNGPETNDGRHAASAEAEHAQVAALAMKVTHLPEPALPPALVERRWRESWRSRLLIALTWLVTIGIGSIALLRILYYDGRHVLIWLNAFTRYVYLPAYVCLAIALWKRRWRLAVVNAVIIGCHLFWLAPDFMRDRRFDVAPSAVAPHGDVHSVRIFFANVRVLNTEHTALLAEIEKANPDVVVLVEFSWLWAEAFRKAPLMATFPYGSGMARNRIDSVNLFSKLPLKSETGEWIADRYVESADIQRGSEVLRVIGIHAPRPMNLRANDYDGFWKRVVPLLLNEPHPLVVVGDFNATQYSLVYQQLKAGGLRSAHEDRGRGYATSWPNGRDFVPPIRIDQAFLSPDVECLGIIEGEGRGSDHKPFILDVQIGGRP